jgi:hypothetical protein
MINFFFLLLIALLLFIIMLSMRKNDVLGVNTTRNYESYYTANEMQDRKNRNDVLYGILPYSQKIINQLKSAEEVENFVTNDPDSRLIFPEGGPKWIPCWECEQEVYAVREQGCDGKRNYTQVPTRE